mgnify:CR=1 FL=1
MSIRELIDPAALADVTLSHEEIKRYSRHLIMPEVGMSGQKKRKAASVLLIGAGGLGSPLAMYLAAAGVGQLLLADGDRVDLSNLQRQIAHTTERLGQTKVGSAQHSLRAINPEVEVECLDTRLEAEALQAQVERVDLVVDASDNFPTRFALNLACHRSGKPLVSGAAIRWEGQVAVFGGQPGGPCYRCLYPEAGTEDTTCSENGILAPVAGIVGSIQATEAIKLLSLAGTPLLGRLLLVDALRMEWRQFKVTPDPGCPVCSGER